MPVIRGEMLHPLRVQSDSTRCVVSRKVTTHITETVGLLTSQIVHHTLAGIEAGTAVVKRSTRAQVPKTYFIYCTFRRITMLQYVDTLMEMIEIMIESF